MSQDVRDLACSVGWREGAGDPIDWLKLRIKQWQDDYDDAGRAHARLDHANVPRVIDEVNLPLHGRVAALVIERDRLSKQIASATAVQDLAPVKLAKGYVYGSPAWESAPALGARFQKGWRDYVCVAHIGADDLRGPRAFIGRPVIPRGLLFIVAYAVLIFGSALAAHFGWLH